MQKPVEKFLFKDRDSDEFSDLTLEYMKTHTIEDLVGIVKSYETKIEKLKASNIPQFSDFKKVDDVVRIVSDASEPVDYKYVGYMIKKDSKEGAQTKYGENHLKLAIQMGLISEKPYKVTKLGMLYIKLREDERDLTRIKLVMRIPLIQRMLVESENQVIRVRELLRESLSESTVIRRESSAKAIVKEILNNSSVDLKKQIMDNVKWGKDGV